MKKYSSKIDLWLLILLTVVFGGAMIQMLVDHVWIGLIVILIPAVLIVTIFSSTTYAITENELIIKCGLFYKLVVPVKDIRKISESNNLISSPALSLDRLEILYNKFDTVLISPKPKLEFIAEIKRVNPEIEISVKK